MPSWGGAPAILVPDNLRSGVTRAHRYEPDINPTYAEMAAHYGAVISPTRPRKPRDKPDVLFPRRGNGAIRERLTWLNERPFKKLPGSRRSLFEEIDRPALRPLPAVPYEYALWKGAKVSIKWCEPGYGESTATSRLRPLSGAT